MPISTQQRVSKWLWIAVMAVLGLFGLYGASFELMIVLALVGGLIVLFVKAFIWAARNDKGIVLYDENGNQYRAFKVGDADSHRWMEEYRNPAHPNYVFQHHDEED